MIRALIADDHALMRDGLRHILEKARLLEPLAERVARNLDRDAEALPHEQLSVQRPHEPSNGNWPRALRATA